MIREATIVILWVAIGLIADVCPAQVPSPSYRHLTFLEPFIGQRQLTETKEGMTQAAGVEVAEWILNKSFGDLGV